MWFKTGLLSGLLLAALVSSPRADIQCDGIDDILTSALTVAGILPGADYTLMLYLNSSGSVFAQDSCWPDGVAIGDTGGYLALGRSGTEGTGNACSYAYDGANRRVTSPVSVGWHHVTVRVLAGTLELFVDEASVGTQPMGALEDTTGLLQLCGTGSGYSPDRLTEVKVYASGLPSALIHAMAQSRLQAFPGPQPAAYWPLTDCPDGTSGNGVSFKDRSGNNRHLTGNHGANATGLTCLGNRLLVRPGGIQ